MFELRIVCVDYYLTVPTKGFDVTYSSFRMSCVKQVPVIRIFGITSNGLKACVHIHGVFPYIYVPYDGCENPNSLMARMAHDIDFGINNATPGLADKARQHVFKITLVSGIPFYGFHKKAHQFFKIYFYNPYSVKKALVLFEAGSVCNMNFQPHEAHIPYVLQFFIDYNLYGMSFLKLSSYKLRPQAHVSNTELGGSQGLYRISYCEIEGDAVAECIMNKLSPGGQCDAANPGLAALWEEEKSRRLKEGKSMDSMIQQSQTIHDSQPTASDSAFRQQLLQAILARLESVGEETSQIGYAAETPDSCSLQDASFRDNHNLMINPQEDMATQKSPQSEIFDENDLELIKLLEGQTDLPKINDEVEQDSILGSQNPGPGNEEHWEEEDEAAEDLTVPFSPVSSGSIFGTDNLVPEPNHGNEESYNEVWNPWEESSWIGQANLTQVEEGFDTGVETSVASTDENVERDRPKIYFVDGTVDSSSSDEDLNLNLVTTPPNKMPKLKDVTPDKRYQPLSISVQRSPESENQMTPPKFIVTPKKYSPRLRKKNYSPNISDAMKELQKNASQINEILLSPKSSQLSNSTLLSSSPSSFKVNSSSSDFQGASSCIETKKINVSKNILNDFDGDEYKCPSSKEINSSKCDKVSDSLHNVKLTLTGEENTAPKSNNILVHEEVVQDSNSRYNLRSKTVYSGAVSSSGELESRTIVSAKKKTSNKQITLPLSQIIRTKTTVKRKRKSKNLRIQVLSNVAGSSRSSASNLQSDCTDQSAGLVDSKGEDEEVNSKNVQTEEQQFSHVRKTLFPALESSQKSESSESYHTAKETSISTESLENDISFDSSPKPQTLSEIEKSCNETQQNSEITDFSATISASLDVLSADSCSQTSDLAVPLSDTHSQSLSVLSPQGSNKNSSQSNEEVISINQVSPNYIRNNESLQISLNHMSLPYFGSNKVSEKDCSLVIHDEGIPEGIVSFYNKTFHIPNLTEQKPSKKPMIFSLAYNPPTKNDVINNMLNYGLSAESGLMPFYGNPRDSASCKEVGVDLVRLPSLRINDLEEYRGDMGNPLEESKKLLMSSALSSSCKENSKTPHFSSHRKVVIAHVRKPPSRSEAEEWKKSLKNIIEESPKEVNVKGILELAMFAGSQNESDVMTLTPCTPQSSQLSNTDLASSGFYGAHSTPAVVDKSIFSPAVTPIVSSSHFSQNIQKESSLPPILENDEFNPKSGHSTNSKSSMVTQLDVQSGCDIHNATPENSGLFKLELQNLQDAHSVSLHRHTTLMVVEIHCQTRGDLKPDPEYDAISAVFYCISNDVPPNFSKPSMINGVIIHSPSSDPKRRYTSDCVITQVETELDLIMKLVALVRQWDPDIIAGYETEMLSWGFIIQRGYALDLNLMVELSRVNTVPLHQPEVNLARGLDVKLVGRITLNVWRLMRHEVALMSYSFENIMYHVLHTRVSKFSFKTLTMWWSHCSLHYREFVIKYYLTRVIGTCQILDQLDFIGSTSELASLFGIQFYEVLSRGSQFRVESMMIRLAKLQNFVTVSPSIRQRAEMRAPACIPLVMEPKSRFYGDPVILLDFQSLYPSMMIAYNYCFSTCLGRIEYLKQHERFEFGCTELKIPLKLLDKLKDKIHVSPVGVVFVTPEVRKGLISKMVEEILETRLMVKKSMKDHKNDKLLQRVLHARQLGLKLIANVTYGYTSANFSGRMPSVEIADSIVSKGRETLERVIKMVNSHPTWKCQVVYGDTDSVFVLCPGRTRQEAFVIGQEISDAATKDNPRPVKLKLEKVYQPCILQTKKRYVGFMYEAPDQVEPVYDAKGIETVRRDGCPAVSKILEKSLKILFRTRDVSQVKDYVCSQMTKIFTGRINLQDVIFAKEYRGMFGYKPGACVPALKIAREILQVDRRGEPRAGERVGYVIVCGPPGVPLIKLTTPPYLLIQDPSLRINPEYYILKAILPPLDRCFTLIGTNVFAWYQEFPKKMPCKIGVSGVNIGMKKSTISQYFASMKCVLCREMTTDGICSNCQESPHLIAAGLAEKVNSLEYNYFNIKKVCESCCGRKVDIDCVSLDCPVMYRREQAFHHKSSIDFLNQLSSKYLPELF